MRRSRVALLCAGVLAAGALAVLPASTGYADIANQVRIAGLDAPASVIRDKDGVPHIKAGNAHDLFFLQGWVHADDRLFQMDVSRRRASGTLAELLGSSALPSDVQMRTLGLRRTAERSQTVNSAETQEALRAYADGVNAWIANNPLPGQYAAVQVTKVEPWTVVDSLTVSKSLLFLLSFDLDIDRTTIVQGYNAAGFDGHTAVFNDLFPFAPFNNASPVIDSTARPAKPAAAAPATLGRTGVSEPAARLAADYLAKAQQVPMLADALNRDPDRGSNSWVISGRHTANGQPILASDPHLPAEIPSTTHPIGLEGAGFDTQGESLPGSPFVILGQNRHIAFGATAAPHGRDRHVHRADPTGRQLLQWAVHCVQGPAQAGHRHRRDVPGQHPYPGPVGLGRRRTVGRSHSGEDIHRPAPQRAAALSRHQDGDRCCPYSGPDSRPPRTWTRSG